MNETDLKVTCKAIKGFDYLIQWQIVEFVRTTVACSATFNHSIMEKYFRYAIYDEAVKITFFLYTWTRFALAWHIFKEFWLQDIQLYWVPSSITFLSFCFVKKKQFLYRWYYATKKRDWWAWHCRCWLENIFNVQSYLWLWLTYYLDELARQLAISSPNKIRPFKQRFLSRKTSNPAISKSDNSFKYSSYAIELMNISLCRNNPNNLRKQKSLLQNSGI